MSNVTDSLNNAIAYSYVLGWYAGRDGKATDGGKIQATKDMKARHPDIVRACNVFPLTLQALSDIIASENLQEAKSHARKIMSEMQ